MPASQRDQAKICASMLMVSKSTLPATSLRPACTAFTSKVSREEAGASLRTNCSSKSDSLNPMRFSTKSRGDWVRLYVNHPILTQLPAGLEIAIVRRTVSPTLTFVTDADSVQVIGAELCATHRVGVGVAEATDDSLTTYNNTRIPMAIVHPSPKMISRKPLPLKPASHLRCPRASAANCFFGPQRLPRFPLRPASTYYYITPCLGLRPPPIDCRPPCCPQGIGNYCGNRPPRFPGEIRRSPASISRTMAVSAALIGVGTPFSWPFSTT